MSDMHSACRFEVGKPHNSDESKAVIVVQAGVLSTTSLKHIEHMKQVIVIGGGLAGVEAAWQAARAGAHVRLFEMRPISQTPAHRTDKLAEIVCSNSLKSDEPGTAPYLLKEELRRAESLVMEAAAATRVPAGAALAVDRQLFAEYITEKN